MANTDNFLFQSQVEHQNKSHTLTLTKWLLIWETSTKAHASDSHVSEPLIGHDACLDLKEVVGVKPIKIPPKSSTVSIHKAYKKDESVPFCIEMQPIGPVGFSVFVITRPGGHKWKCRQISFQCKDSNLCQQWITMIKEALRAPAFNRPQKLIVFVNPFSGKKKGVKLYREKVLPLFELADIKVTLIETERQNHARDLVKDSLDLTDVDGLVCVGGDGMFSEILNGLLNRTERDHHIEEKCNFDPVPPDIRIGIIPAGSTNTIVYTTTGVSDALTSTLHIVLGDEIGIDVNSVNVNDQFIRYSVTMLGYGYMGDLLRDSDNLRWMGPKRYNFSGTKKFLANNAYYGEIKFRLSSNNESHPTDEVKCLSGCETCYMAKEDSSNSLSGISNSLSSISNIQSMTIEGSSRNICDNSNRYTTGEGSSGNNWDTSNRDGSADSNCDSLNGFSIGEDSVGSNCDNSNRYSAEGCSTSNVCDTMNRYTLVEDNVFSNCDTSSRAVDFSAGRVHSQGSEDEWQTVIGKFVAVNSVTMSCSCDLSPPGMSPYCHLGDGCMDLILVQDCSRLDFLKFLMRTAKGEERHKLDFIKMYRVKEFTFRPLTEESDLDSISSTQDLSETKKAKLRRQTSRTSVWNCDGEVIHHPKVNVRVHCQLVKLFARGIEDPNMSDEQKCKTCCAPGFERL